MNIEELTLGQLREINSLFIGAVASSVVPTPVSSPYIVGEKYFIRTATYHHVGRLSAIYENELVLSEASWVADSGRFNNALVSGELNEVEPFVNPVIIARGGIIDVTVWDGELPTKVK